MPSEIANILGFLGYGNPAGPIWFVGIEEGLGGQTEADSEQNWLARGTFEPIMDLYDAHMRLCANGNKIDITTMKRLPQAWLWMARIALAHNGFSEWENQSAVTNYVCSKLGRKSEGTFLTELSPVPRASGNDQRWKKAVDLNDRKVVDLIEGRRRTLQKLLSEHRPDLIVSYGTGTHRLPQHQDFFGLGGWKVKSVKGVDRRFYISGDGRGLVLPFFGQGMMTRKLFAGLAEGGYFRGSTQQFGPLS